MGTPISSMLMYGSGEITDRAAKSTLFPIMFLRKSPSFFSIIYTKRVWNCYWTSLDWEKKINAWKCTLPLMSTISTCFIPELAAPLRSQDESIKQLTSNCSLTHADWSRSEILCIIEWIKNALVLTSKCTHCSRKHVWRNILVTTKCSNSEPFWAVVSQ